MVSFVEDEEDNYYYLRLTDCLPETFSGEQKITVRTMKVKTTNKHMDSYLKYFDYGTDGYIRTSFKFKNLEDYVGRLIIVTIDPYFDGIDDIEYSGLSYKFKITETEETVKTVTFA